MIKSTSKSKKKLAYCLLPIANMPIVLMTIIFFLTHTAEINPTIRYVSHTGNSTPPYTSWETAADSIQKAIDICVDGDTIYIANGVYTETIVIHRAITLIGSSIDSTIIDGTDLSLYKTVEFTAQGTITNIWIKGQGIQYEGSTSVLSLFTNFIIKDCKISNAKYAIFTGYSSALIKRCIMDNIKQAIRSPCFPDTCNVIIDSCIINTRLYETAMHFTYGSPTITHNIVFQENKEATVGIYLDATTRSAIIKNNLISGYDFNNISISAIQDSAVVSSNNTLYTYRQNPSAGAIITYTGSKTIIRNNIIGYNYRGLNSYYDPVNSDYNLFWDNEFHTTRFAVLNDSDLIAYPMFVKDTLPNPQFNFDYHLQAYSPAIDAGNPEILDVDGSRSDIGMFGGPLGENYKYEDLAPRPPRNLSALVDTSYILVKWNRNTEADTSHYNVYRDTVANFTIDSTKLISSQTDTFYIQYAPYQSSRYVYKITCVDNQGNESFPSEELVINITSLTMNDYPMTVNDYLLYQNYPNPFNPTTTIAYKLKERAYVKLMVYDIKGELISVLVNNEQESGYYEVEFSASSIQNQESSIKGLASGIYLYRIEVIGEGRILVYADMKKMIILK